MTTLAQSIQGTVIWGGFRVWQRNRDAFLRAWKVEVGGIAIEPFVVLIAMGFGLGEYIDEFGESTCAVHSEYLPVGTEMGVASLTSDTFIAGYKGIAHHLLS